MPNLVVFRNDLRVNDNTALYQAQQSGDGVIGLFCYTPKQWQAHGLGDNKIDFVHKHIAALSAALAKKNIPLLISVDTDYKAAVKSIVKRAKEHQVNEVHINIEYEWNERQRDKVLHAALEKAGIELKRHVDQSVIHPSAVKTGNGDYYKVFTPYKRAWIRHCQEQGLPHNELRIKKQKALDVQSDALPKNLRGYTLGPTATKTWPIGETKATKLLETFINERVINYKKDRDLPGIKGTSLVSAYLAIGVLSPGQCLRAALAANDGRFNGGNEGIDTWISELVWREYYRHVAFGFPHIVKGHAFKRDTDRIIWNDNNEHYLAWCEGQTGIPIVDAGMRQLVQTGWMHNRVRMIVAMFLSKNLFLDWRLGEAFFNKHLIDADFASNNGGWQWSASTGTDAAPYFRIFNPYSQSQRFDPKGEYIKKYVPELAELTPKQIHEPHKTGLSDIDYPEPIVDCKKTRQAAIEAFKNL